MIRKLSFLALLSVSVAIAACANRPAKVHNIAAGAMYVVDYSASRRGAYIRVVPSSGSNPAKSLVCAEPAPDVAVALTADLQAQLKAAQSQVEVDAKAKISEAIIDLARRGQTLQIQREVLYRLCELHVNGGLTNAEVAKLYVEVLKIIQVIAYAELGNSRLPDETKAEILNSIVKGNVLAP